MEEKKFNVNIDHTEPAFFTDSVTIIHRPGKFVIDFTQTIPRVDQIGGGPKHSLAIKHKTILMDPSLAKNFLEILKDNIDKYEKNFGEIKIKKGKKIEDKKISSTESTTRYIG